MKMVLSKRKKFIKKETRNKLESTLVDSIMIPDLQNGFTKKKNKGYETRIKMAYRWKSGIVLLFLHGHDLVFDPKTLALLSRKAARSGILLLMSLKNEEVSFQI